MTLWNRWPLVMIGGMKPRLFIHPLIDEERAPHGEDLGHRSSFNLVALLNGV
jgi:hypothetical protein